MPVAFRVEPRTDLAPSECAPSPRSCPTRAPTPRGCRRGPADRPIRAALAPAPHRLRGQARGRRPCPKDNHGLNEPPRTDHRHRRRRRLSRRGRNRCAGRDHVERQGREREQARRRWPERLRSRSTSEFAPIPRRRRCGGRNASTRSKRRAAAGRIFEPVPVAGRPDRRCVRRLAGLGPRRRSQRLAQEHPQDSLVLLHLGYANLWAGDARTGDRGLAASDVRPAGHHVGPTCGRRPASWIPTRRAAVRPELRAAGPPRRAVAAAPVRAPGQGRGQAGRAREAPVRGRAPAARAPALGSAAVRRSRATRSRRPGDAGRRSRRPLRQGQAVRRVLAPRPAHEALSHTPPRCGSTSASCSSGWPVLSPAALAEGKRQLRLARNGATRLAARPGSEAPPRRSRGRMNKYCANRTYGP